MALARSTIIARDSGDGLAYYAEARAVTQRIAAVRRLWPPTERQMFDAIVILGVPKDARSVRRPDPHSRWARVAKRVCGCGHTADGHEPEGCVHGGCWCDGFVNVAVSSC